MLSPGDPLLQMRDRDLLVPDAKLQRVVWKNLAPAGVVLIGTDVAGVVRAQKKQDTLALRIELVAASARKARSAVEEEAGRLAEARGLGRLTIAWT